MSQGWEGVGALLIFQWADFLKCALLDTRKKIVPFVSFHLWREANGWRSQYQTTQDMQQNWTQCVSSVLQACAMENVLNECRFIQKWLCCDVLTKSSPIPYDLSWERVGCWRRWVTAFIQASETVPCLSGNECLCCSRAQNNSQDHTNYRPWDITRDPHCLSTVTIMTSQGPQKKVLGRYDAGPPRASSSLSNLGLIVHNCAFLLAFKMKASSWHKAFICFMGYGKLIHPVTLSCESDLWVIWAMVENFWDHDGYSYPSTDIKQRVNNA